MLVIKFREVREKEHNYNTINSTKHFNFGRLFNFYFSFLISTN